MVGVDIGSTAVRVVEITGVDSEGFALISRIGIAQLPEGAVVAGRIRSVQAVSLSLVRALRDAGVPRYGFVLGLASSDTALTTMAFPSIVKPEEREGAIRAMGNPLSTTFGLEESTISTYLAGSSAPEEGSVVATVGVAAVLTTDIDLLTAVCSLARCSPLAIDLSGAALVRALTRVNAASSEVHTVVDVGASKVMVATRQDMYMRSLRTTVGAGDEITRAIAGAANVSFEEAEQLKFGMVLSSAQSSAGMGYGLDENTVSQSARRSPVEVVLSNQVDFLVDSIAQSIDGDAGNFGSKSQGVSLAGGTALLKGFKNRLQQRVGIPVTTARPWAEIERSRRNTEFFVDNRTDPRVLLTLSVAVGLALWKKPS